MTMKHHRMVSLIRRRKIKSKFSKMLFVGKLENSTTDLNSTVDLNTTSMSLDDNSYVPEYPIDKTMSQICENQNRADEMIDGCSKIVPEQDETDNNMSTLFSQTDDNISVSELLDLCSGSFVTQPASVS